MKVRRIVEETAREVHECWRMEHRADGLKSRLSTWDEELLVPWEDLSERAKDLNRQMVKTTLTAFAKLIA